MEIRINDQNHQLPEGTTLAELIRRFASHDATVAAVNDTFVPRGLHHSHVLTDGDRVELLSPMEGG